jgi:hypothetical protein
MKVHLIRKETIARYAAGNARSKPSFAVWLTAVKYADWNAFRYETNIWLSRLIRQWKQPGCV